MLPRTVAVEVQPQVAGLTPYVLRDLGPLLRVAFHVKPIGVLVVGLVLLGLAIESLVLHDVDQRCIDLHLVLGAQIGRHRASQEERQHHAHGHKCQPKRLFPVHAVSARR